MDKREVAEYLEFRAQMLREFGRFAEARAFQNEARTLRAAMRVRHVTPSDGIEVARYTRPVEKFHERDLGVGDDHEPALAGQY